MSLVLGVKEVDKRQRRKLGSRSRGLWSCVWASILGQLIQRAREDMEQQDRKE